MATGTEHEYGLISFIRARLDWMEFQVDRIGDFVLDEDSARGGWGSRGDCMICDAYAFDGTEDVTKQAAWEHLEEFHQRSRVLREVEFFRWVLEQHRHEFWMSMPPQVSGCHQCVIRGIQKSKGWCPTIVQMGSIWRDHHDYKQDWAVAA